MVSLGCTSADASQDGGTTSTNRHSKKLRGKSKASPPRPGSPANAEQVAESAESQVHRAPVEELAQHQVAAAPQGKQKKGKGKKNRNSLNGDSTSPKKSEGVIEDGPSPGTSPEASTGMDLSSAAMEKAPPAGTRGSSGGTKEKKKNRKSRESPKGKNGSSDPLNESGNASDGVVFDHADLSPGEISYMKRLSPSPHHPHRADTPTDQRKAKASPRGSITTDPLPNFKPTRKHSTGTTDDGPNFLARLRQESGDGPHHEADGRRHSGNEADLLVTSRPGSGIYGEPMSVIDHRTSLRDSIVESELMMGHLPVHTASFALCHEVVRNDLKLFQTAIEKLDVTLPWQVKSLRRWFSIMGFLLDNHHGTVREGIVYPWVSARGYQPQHPKVSWATIDESLDKTMGMMEELEGLCAVHDFDHQEHIDGRTRVLLSVRRQVDNMVKIIFSYIDEEEAAFADVRERIGDHGEWAHLEQTILKSFKHKKQRLIIPWMMQTLDSTRRRAMLKGMTVRLAYRYAWKPKFEKTYLDPLQRVIFEDTNPGDVVQGSLFSRLFRPCKGPTDEHENVLVL